MTRLTAAQARRDVLLRVSLRVSLSLSQAVAAPALFREAVERRPRAATDEARARALHRAAEHVDRTANARLALHWKLAISD